EDDFGLSGDYEDDEEEEWEGEVDWTQEVDEVEDAQKFTALGDDDDDELEEESLLETPLDKVEPYGLFRDALLQLQQEQPQLYESLAKNLNAEEQQTVQAAVHQADVLEQQAAHALMLDATPQANGNQH
ncbi:hypothetical protein B0A49_02237, partial [Cryomyces minteri]